MAERIQGVHLRLRGEQGLLFMLSVNVDEGPGEMLKSMEGGEHSIDVNPVATGSRQDSTNDEFCRTGFQQIKSPKPIGDRPFGRNRE